MVGEFIPWLSDHCPIMSTISMNFDKSENNDDHNDTSFEDVIPRHKWDLNSEASFNVGLDSNCTGEKIRSLLCDESITVDKLAEEITNMLLNNAKVSNLKTTNKRKCNKNNRPWFDQECQKQKREVRRQANALIRNPYDSSTREKLYSEKTKLKKIVVKKKLSYKESILQEISSKTEQKEYWRLINKLINNKDDNLHVSEQKLLAHFQKLLYGSTNDQFPINDSEVGELDYIITTDELKKATTVLKTGKAPGHDNILNEMLKCLVGKYPDLILKLFNMILRSNNFVPSWLLSVIVPIYKKGNKSDPANYRGIALLSSLGKLFLTILHIRLQEFVQKRNILKTNQLGFIKGSSTSDAHIMIHNLIDEYCHKRKKHIYSCYVDFEKAFDNIPRDMLFKKLFDMGIKGNFFNIIKHLYADDTAVIKVNNKISKPFRTNRGLRQGCVLSPLLFNLYMSEFTDQINDCPDKVELTADTELGGILWADDILLLSESEKGLREMLLKLESFCHLNKLNVNVDKTKCMIFNKAGRRIHRNFYYKGVLIEHVNVYK